MEINEFIYCIFCWHALPDDKCDSDVGWWGWEGAQEERTTPQQCCWDPSPDLHGARHASDTGPSSPSEMGDEEKLLAEAEKRQRKCQHSQGGDLLSWSHRHHCHGVAHTILLLWEVAGARAKTKQGSKDSSNTDSDDLRCNVTAWRCRKSFDDISCGVTLLVQWSYILIQPRVSSQTVFFRFDGNCPHSVLLQTLGFWHTKAWRPLKTQTLLTF